MDRNTFISSFKMNILNRAPKAFMLFLAFVIVTECSIHFLSPLLAASSEYLDIKSRVLVVQMEGLNRDILIFGDSSAGVSINPNRLQKDTGLSCANLATRVGTTVAANYFLFQDYLETNKPPKYIILMRGFHNWPGTQNYSTNELLLSNFPERMFELLVHPGLAGNNYGVLLKSIPGYLLPSQRNRLPIRKTAWTVIGRKKIIPELLTEYHQKIAERKQRILGENPYNIGREGTAEEREQNLINEMKFVNNNTFDTSAWSTYYLEQLITLAEQKGTAIHICLPPVRQELYEADAGRAYLQASKLFIKDIVDSYDNVFLLTDDFYYVTAYQIRDNGNHLSAEESIIFTDMLAKKILAFEQST